MGFHVWFETVNCTFGLILPVYVIYIVVFHTSNPGVKVYRQMLITNSVVDILYAFSTLVAIPNFYFASNKLYLLLENPLLPENPTILFGVFAIQVYFIYLSVFILPIQFMYRYRVVALQQYSFGTILKPLTGAAIYLAVHCYLLKFTFFGNEEQYDKVLLDAGLEGHHLYYVGDAERKFWLVPHYGSCMVVCAISYFAIIIYYNKAQNCLKNFENHLVPATKKAQKQMAKIIMLQAIYPIFLLCTPSFLLAFGAAIRLQSHVLGDICAVLLHLTPALNALSVIVCVPSYRKVTVKLFFSWIPSSHIKKYVNTSRVRSYSSALKH